MNTLYKRPNICKKGFRKNLQLEYAEESTLNLIFNIFNEKLILIGKNIVL